MNRGVVKNPGNSMTSWRNIRFSRSTVVAAVAQWLRCRATNRKVAGSIPDGVTGIFH